MTKTPSISMPITTQTKVTDVLNYVMLQYPDLPLNHKTILITVNEELASPDTVVKANDTVAFLPHIGGG